jgi:glucose dehydrogenase
MTQDDHRFSPLTQINEQTVATLGLVWSRELGTTRGLEATPLVENGMIYTTGSWSVVYAIDAKAGNVRWTYDPKVPRERAYFICCDVVNRGVALYRGKVYVGTLDGATFRSSEFAQLLQKRALKGQQREKRQQRGSWRDKIRRRCLPPQSRRFPFG